MSIGSHGYGQIGWQENKQQFMYLAHRVAWVIANGQIPDGLTIDHLCRTRRCVNPAHLRLLTNVENATDNGQSKKTHCPHGHEYAGENLIVNRDGSRGCRACARRHKERRKATGLDREYYLRTRGW